MQYTYKIFELVIIRNWTTPLFCENCRKNNRRPVSDDGTDVHFEGVTDDKQSLLTEVNIDEDEEEEA